MKRVGLIFSSLAIALALLAGCAVRSGGNAPEERMQVVTTFFPLYDFARVIGGEDADVINLVPAGVEPHDWTPRSQEMATISRAQLFVYQGAGFEGWTEDVLGGIDANNLVIVEASRGIELIAAADSHGGDEHGHEDEEEAHEGEEAAHEDEHEDEHEGEHEDGHEEEHDHGDFDPHTWLSPRSAMIMAENILAGFKQADPGHAAGYESRFASLADELAALDAEYSERLASVSNKEMVVSHQAFGYLARDYGLVQMPIMGIAPNAEPTAQDLKEISEFVEEHGVKYIFTEELVSDALARTLANDLGIETLPLHPLEGLTEAEAAANETYISIMERNLEHLVIALKQP